MPFIQVGQENSGKIELYYEDHGSGNPVVLIHGWPLSGASWEKQVPALLAAKHRVITYDRRGFGASSKPSQGYDYDTFARDLDTLLTRLELQNVTLVGFSMGGGEVARYIGTFGSKRVKKAAFIAAITPCLLQSADGDNAAGVPGEVFAGIRRSLAQDRPAFLNGFLSNFFNFDSLKKATATAQGLISEEVLRLNWMIACGASPQGTSECVTAWGKDFRKDLARLDVPTLVVHGNADRIVPLEASGGRMREFVKQSRLVVIDGAPHGLNWTHAERLNQELLAFLGSG